MSGKICYALYDYAAYNFRTGYKKMIGKEEFLQDFLKDKQGLRVQTFEVRDADSIYMPVKCEYECVIKNKLNELGAEYQLIPVLYEQLKTNPFKNPQRKFPVDFAYGTQKSIIVKIALPEKLMVTALPEGVSYKLPGNSASFTYQVNVHNNIVQLSCNFSIDKPLFVEEEYADLREFYYRIIEKESEPVILSLK
jgi:hypothetical protein